MSGFPTKQTAKPEFLWLAPVLWSRRYERDQPLSIPKPLRGGLAGYYRLRTGDYRLQFHVEGETVFVEKIGHRHGFYED
jgi:mRNA-degrading endonuclease RelE of RelBE toxin-antitoxin system